MRYIAVSGALAAAATFVRPSAYYWPFVVGTTMLFLPAANRIERPFVRLAPVFIFLLVTMTPFMLWTTRNAYQTGYRGFSAAGDYNLYISLASSVEGIHRDTAKQRIDTLAAQNGWKQDERYEYMRREGIQSILDQPLTYLWVHTRAILQSLTPGFSMYVGIYRPDYGSESTLERLLHGAVPPVRDLLFALPMYILVGLACAGQYILAAAGGRRIFSAPNSLTVLVLGSLAYFLIMSGAVGDISYSRMRHSAMPAICVLAGFGASVAIARYRSRETGTTSRRLF